MKIKNIIKNIVAIVLIIVFGFIIFTLAFGYKGYAVVTDSMNPEFRKGDAVFVKETPFEELSVGDIVTVSFKDGNGTFTHRIVELDKENGEFYTQGDNSEVKDGVSTKEQVVGKVMFSLPFAGYLSMVVSNKTVLAFILLAIILVTFVIIAISHKQNKVRGDKNEQ